MKHIYLLIVSLGLIASPNLYANVPVVDRSQHFTIAANDIEDQPQIHHTREVPEVPEVQAKQNPAQDLSILLEKIDRMQQDIQRLRGQIEVQAHDLKLLQQQQEAFYKDLDERIAKIRPEARMPQGPQSAVTQQPPVQAQATKQPVAATIIPKPSRLPANPADEHANYTKAYELVRAKQFDQAIVAMNNFISDYPNSEYGSNANYWLGELHLTQGDNQKAQQFFKQVVDKYPKSNKVSAAMLKLGFIYFDQGDYSAAKETLSRVQKEFPNTSTARLATNRLRAINQLD